MQLFECLELEPKAKLHLPRSTYGKDAGSSADAYGVKIPRSAAVRIDSSSDTSRRSHGCVKASGQAPEVGEVEHIEGADGGLNFEALPELNRPAEHGADLLVQAVARGVGRWRSKSLLDPAQGLQLVETEKSRRDESLPRRSWLTRLVGVPVADRGRQT